jgi:molybdate transport system substrate-binding protein
VRAGWLLLVTLLLSGCGSSTQRDTLTVFAAASLTDAFEAVEVTYEAQYPSVDLVFNFAGSSTLVTQLDDGAPADVFASANQTQMDRARSAGVIAGEPVAFAGNRLALIVSMGNPAGVTLT